MKQYIYSPAEAGRESWPSGELRLEGIEQTADPDQADLFVCPGNLSLFKDDLSRLDRLPFMARAEERHVFFDVSDNFTESLHRKVIFIRCDARNWMLKDDPGTIQMAWPVEDYAECVDVPEGGFTYDVSFHGWLSTDTRIASSNACLTNANLKCDIRQYSDFTGYIYHEPEGVRRRAEFRRSMRESRLALCPESITGVLPYRFFEAMSAGRVPVLVSSDYVLPFSDEIPYDKFTVEIPRADAAKAGAAIREILNHFSDEELIYMGQQARLHWLQWLNSANWSRTMTYAVEKQLTKRWILNGFL